MIHLLCSLSRMILDTSAQLGQVQTTLYPMAQRLHEMASGANLSTGNMIFAQSWRAPELKAWCHISRLLKLGPGVLLLHRPVQTTSWFGDGCR